MDLLVVPFVFFSFTMQMYKDIFTSVTSVSVSEHLNEEVHSVTPAASVCVCVMRCKLTNYLVCNFDAENCTQNFSFFICGLDLVQYNFVLDWHVLWYVCTAVCLYQLHHCKLVLIRNSIRRLSQILPPWTSPSYRFLCWFSFSIEKHGVFVI